MAAPVTHRERIANLEMQFERLERGIDKIDRLEEQMERLLRRRSRKRGSSSSSKSPTDSDRSSDDIHVIRSVDGDNRSRKGEDRGRGRPKITCPVFNDTDPVSWLSRISQYFDLNEVKKKDQVRYATFYLEGEANVWWQWVSRVYRKKDKILRWKEFEKELMVRFGPSEYTDHDESLAHIQQKGTLREYQQEFERLASRVQD